MPTSGKPLLVLGLLLACVGCASPDDDVVDSDEEAIRAGALKVSLRMAESKVVYSSRVLSFAVKDGGSLDAPCRDESFGLTSKPSLYESGWSPDAGARFAESVSGARYRSHVFASCRKGDMQIFGWFAKERELEFTVGDQFLDEDYKPRDLPLVLEATTLGSGSPKYYSCDGRFKKTQVGETETEKLFDLEVTCKPRTTPTKAELGPIDFVRNPGPYAAVASYRPWALPPVAASSFGRARDALLGKVAEGTYTGAMSTLSKKCGLKIERTAGGLAIEHTIQSSGRTRRVELSPESLLGFAEGDLFADPIRVGGEVTGTFAAAEVKDGRGGTTVVRFEKNSSLDALVVRIDGAEAYCRRLVAP